MPLPEATPARVQGYLSGFSATLAVNQVLASLVAPAPAQARVVRARAGVAGTSGSTVIDLVRNGTSMFTIPANRPTLPFGSVGNFQSTPPNSVAVQAGDLLQLVVAATAGHQQVTATAALEQP
ncbi:MAG TPA: hypothetical protein VFB50_10565 [Chloroflexota bacterium]|nr:hypothetical protein [Chloroflexota bacterium]